MDIVWRLVKAADVENAFWTIAACVWKAVEELSARSTDHATANTTFWTTETVNAVLTATAVYSVTETEVTDAAVKTAVTSVISTSIVDVLVALMTSVT